MGRTEDFGRFRQGIRIINMHKNFAITEVLRFGWQVTKANLGMFIGVIVVAGMLSAVPDWYRQSLEKSEVSGTTADIIQVLLLILNVTIGVAIGIGVTKIALSFCDRIRPRFSMLFEVTGCFRRYLKTYVIYGLMVMLPVLVMNLSEEIAGVAGKEVGGAVAMVGLALLVPAVIWTIRYQYAFYFVIDHGTGAIDALRASRMVTQGVMWKLLGFMILCGLIVVAGLMLLVVGLFVAGPVVIVAQALVYRQLALQTPELAELGIKPIWPSEQEIHEGSTTPNDEIRVDRISEDEIHKNETSGDEITGD